MSGYSTLDTLKTKISEKQIIQLTDDDGLGVVNATVFDQENLNVKNLIDGFLRAGGYTLPLTTVPGELVDLSDNILVCNLTKRRFRNKVPESIEKDLVNLMKLLLNIKTGAFALNVDATTDTPKASTYASNKTAESRTFTKDKLDTY